MQPLGTPEPRTPKAIPVWELLRFIRESDVDLDAAIVIDGSGGWAHEMTYDHTTSTLEIRD